MNIVNGKCFIDGEVFVLMCKSWIVWEIKEVKLKKNSKILMYYDLRYIKR